MTYEEWRDRTVSSLEQSNHLPIDRHRLVEQLKRHEGFRGHPYRDTVGKLTIGYGHNLDDVPISEKVAEMMLLEDLDREERRLEKVVPWFKEVKHPVRRAALLNMAFNLGAHGLSKFRRMWSAINRADWERAAEEALDSKWAAQVGKRAEELAEQLRTGEYRR